MGIALKRYDIQLSETQFGGAIIAAGGKCIVCKAGTPDKETLYDPNTELAIANPLTPVRGKISFCVPVDRNTVDLYIQSPLGQFMVLRNVIPSGDNEAVFHGFRREQTYVIPFSIADATANVEFATGLFIPTTGLVQPSPFVRVTTNEAARTLGVGVVGANTDFITGLSLATAGLVKASLANGAVTLGAGLKVQDSVNAGDAVPEQNVARAGAQIALLLSASTVSAKGFIYLPIALAA